MAAGFGARMLQVSSTPHASGLLLFNSGSLLPSRRHRHDGQLRRFSRRGKRTAVRWVCSGRGDAYVERAIGAVTYVLPLFDGMQYGRFLFAQYPATEALFRPLFPLLRVYSSIPFSNFVLFFAIYLALVRNPSFGRFVRFNAMQACVLDVLIVLPLVAQRIFSPRSGFGLNILVGAYNIIFIALLAAVVFAVVSCLLGKTPRLPLAADAADNQLF